VGLEEPGQQRGAAAQRIGQELTGPTEARQQHRRCWMSDELAQERGALALRGQALDIVERHVGIRRGRQLGEQSPQHRLQ